MLLLIYYRLQRCKLFVQTERPVSRDGLLFRHLQLDQTDSQGPQLRRIDSTVCKYLTRPLLICHPYNMAAMPPIEIDALHCRTHHIAIAGFLGNLVT